MTNNVSKLGWLMALLPLFIINVAYASLYNDALEEEIKLQPGTSFHSIENYGSCDVLINMGDTEDIVIKGNPDDTKLIETKVENGILKFSVKNNQRGWNIRTRNVVIKVTATNLKALRQIGSGTIKLESPLTTSALVLEVKGSGDIIAKTLNATDLAASITGSGDISLGGKVENADIRVNGSGDFSAKELAIENAAVRVVGSGDAYVRVNNTLSATVTGSGDIRYSGSVKNVTSSKTGSGSISKY
ncbi:head GIN domain-containing protein [Olivibacter sitiensis]|uniref:head GIN domain-containing protein n=1 Tax=Olivibacter sitiensis TaxID=376470 RepID=UPI00068897A6|nr:head GIN domain-containing protein [Olivibacter sitiensis]